MSPVLVPYNYAINPKGSPPCHVGMVCVSQSSLELPVCRLESSTPGKVTYAEQVKGKRPDEV